MSKLDFDSGFKLLTDKDPFPWQQALYAKFLQGDIPASCNLPTGLGKTSVIAVWLIALANNAAVPRRLVYVVNRRTVVDQTTVEVEKYKKHRPELAVSTLRGQFADRGEWCADPSKPAVICGTVDMIGSRLLFSGYGIGRGKRPLHAGFLGQDALIVHDEAHLEPAFQKLLESIQCEQRGGRLDDKGNCVIEPKRTPDFKPLKVMELTATPRGDGDVFELTKEEREIPHDWGTREDAPIKYVWKRLKSQKAITFHPSKREEIAKSIGEMARIKWGQSGKAILVFARTIENVKAIVAAITAKKGGVEPDQVQILTGTLRGKERDQMANPRLETGCPVFARFLPKPEAKVPEEEEKLKEEKWKVVPKEGTVYLVCTSAGEVGVDISADHMVCDLTTLDSMTQRLGRVNRRGEGSAEIDVVYEVEADPKKKDDDFEKARWNTKAILERLPKTNDRFDASPLSLRELKLDANERQEAFAPTPTILPVTDMLFDAWALTSITDKLPGRPPVEPYLHGQPQDWQIPETQVAWREEVAEVTGELRKEYTPEDMLDAYPLKPQELLKAPSHQVFKELEAIAERRPQDPAWIVNDDGKVDVVTLSELADKNKKDRIERKTILLPPSAGGLEGGMLNGKHPIADDVADIKGVRQRVWGDDETDSTKDMHSIFRVEFPSQGDEDAEEKVWEWFTVMNQGDKSANKPVLWQVHVDDVEREARGILEGLPLEPSLKEAIIQAAKLHDHGKRRKLFQRVLGNTNPNELWAKSGKRGNRVQETYRHEFGSLLDVDPEVTGKHRELILHLIAAHHGRARPHFGPNEVFDPERPQAAAEAMASTVPRRFAKLQRQYGRWGLAYLESLLRAADWAASSKPSKHVEDAK